ncbi:MAG: M55 family metallopeptidase [bacterium]|nr:M55 family metallopeptidase [bacterium]
MWLRRLVQLTCSLWLLAAVSWAGEREKLKIYISVDMEGLAGVVTQEQLGPSGFEYQRFRQFMTDEVNAAIDGARTAGATEIVVSDSHGNGQNLLIEQLPNEVTIVRSWPRPLKMMQGIDESFDAVLFIGYHTGVTSVEGVRSHTISSSSFAEIRLNGQGMPEAGINAAIAGHFGVPVIMISGDDVFVEEARSLLGDVEAAVVKWAYGMHSARTLTPQAACDLIREKVRRAVVRRNELSPYRLPAPIRLDVRFKHRGPPEVLSYLRFIERTDSHSIRFVGNDMVEVTRFLAFLTEYRLGLQP